VSDTTLAAIVPVILRTLGKISRINLLAENPDGADPASTFLADNPFYTTATGKNKAIFANALGPIQRWSCTTLTLRLLP